MQVAAAQARFLASKQRFDVWLELATPEAHGQGGDELFQVCLLVLERQAVTGRCTVVCLVHVGTW